jgi:hypothetical protein
MRGSYRLPLFIRRSIGLRLIKRGARMFKIKNHRDVIEWAFTIVVVVLTITLVALCASVVFALIAYGRAVW